MQINGLYFAFHMQLYYTRVRFETGFVKSYTQYTVIQYNEYYNFIFWYRREENIP